MSRYKHKYIRLLYQSYTDMSYTFIAKTVQAGIFKTMIEAMKETIPDGNFVLDKNGILLNSMDPTKTVLVCLKLEADKFEYYRCDHKQIIGMNMTNLFKLIKTMTNNDTLTLLIEQDNPNVIGIKIENSEKNSVTTYKLSLLDINEQELKMPPEAFESVICMPSIDFQKYMRDMHSIGDIVEIKSIGQQLILSCKGEFASQETVIGENPNGLSMKPLDKDHIVQGLFALKYLVLFTKCTGLSNQVELYLKNNFPIIVQYSIANLGVVKLISAPTHAKQRG